MICPDWTKWSEMDDGELSRGEARGLREHLQQCADCARSWGWFRGVRKGAPAVPGEASGSACPPFERLAEYAEGVLEAGPAGSIREHLRICAVCREDLEGRKEDLTRSAARGSAPFFPLRRIGWAAAILLAAGVGGVLWGGRGLPFASGRTETAESSFQTGRTYHSPEKTVLRASGVRMELSPLAHLCCLSADAGERIRFRIDRGELTAQVRGGASGLELEVPGGMVRDIGTVFSLRVWETFLPWERSPSPCRITAVETVEGAVELRSGGEWVQSEPGKKGYLLEEGVLFVQDVFPGIRERSFSDLFQSLENALSQHDFAGAKRVWGILLERTARGMEPLFAFLEDGKLFDIHRRWGIFLLGETGGEKAISRLKTMVREHPEWADAVEQAVARIRARMR